MDDRKILHSDANSFFASVEVALNPSLKGKPVAVCGSVEDRHGIVLAKSEIAKRAGITTGMVVWQAKQLCPDLIVKEPHYDEYVRFSGYLHDIYRRYTGYVEPFGLDECWLDVTASSRSAIDIAEDIRNTVKEELGITVSIGVSFNKVFAKLGSDLKKPDAITVISKENFKSKIYSLPCSSMLYCGRKTTEKLNKYGIFTIGDIAITNPELLKRLFGKNGIMLYNFATGKDNSIVMEDGYFTPAKSIGHGVTCNADLVDEQEVWKIILQMSQTLGMKLRESKLKAQGVSLVIKNNNLQTSQMQGKLPYPTQASPLIAKRCFELFKEYYKWDTNVRAVTVTAINLEDENTPHQSGMFDDYDKIHKIEILDKTADSIRMKYGDDAIKSAVLYEDMKISDKSKKIRTVMPKMSKESDKNTALN